MLVAGVQLALQIYRRKNRFKLAATTPAPTPSAPRAVAGAAAPAPAPAPAAPAPARAVTCGSCGITLRLAAPSGARFRCPKCQTIGVAP